jgi:hypothetical protein
MPDGTAPPTLTMRTATPSPQTGDPAVPERNGPTITGQADCPTIGANDSPAVAERPDEAPLSLTSLRPPPRLAQSFGLARGSHAALPLSLRAPAAGPRIARCVVLFYSSPTCGAPTSTGSPPPAPPTTAPEGPAWTNPPATGAGAGSGTGPGSATAPGPSPPKTCPITTDGADTTMSPPLQ